MSSSSRAVSSIAKESLKVFLSEKRCFNKYLDKLKVTYETDGRCVCEMNIEPRHCDSKGMLHGGMTTMLVDVVGSLAIATKPGRKHGVSVDLNISFLNSINVGEDVVIDARNVKFDKRLAFSEVKITNKCDGELVATGKETKFIGEGIPPIKW